MIQLGAATDAIGDGEVIGVPTDTVYGIAADPWSRAAVERLFELKGRPEHKPVGLLAGSIDQVAEIADLSSVRDLTARHWPGALTLVVAPRVVIPDWIAARSVATVGVRVPDHELLRRLLERTGPLAVTSCNKSGEPEVLDDEAARAVFGEMIPLYLPGRSPGGQASTVVDATGAEPVVLRPGPIRL